MRFILKFYCIQGKGFSTVQRLAVCWRLVSHPATRLDCPNSMDEEREGDLFSHRVYPCRSETVPFLKATCHCTVRTYRDPFDIACAEPAQEI